MPFCLVTYDIEKTTMNPHQKVLDLSSDFGWFYVHQDYLGAHPKLPNTTLTGTFDSLTDAQQAFFNLIGTARHECNGVLTLEKFLISEMAAHIFVAEPQR